LPTSGLSTFSTNEVRNKWIIAVGAQVHTRGIKAKQTGSNRQTPGWLDISRNRRSTVKTTTTLMLTARVLTGLLLGSSSAMADGSDVINDYQAAKILVTQQAQLGQVQAGASDVDTPRNGFQLARSTQRHLRLMRLSAARAAAEP
jgi:hypothetical protein